MRYKNKYEITLLFYPHGRSGDLWQEWRSLAEVEISGRSGDLWQKWRSLAEVEISGRRWKSLAEVEIFGRGGDLWQKWRYLSVDVSGSGDLGQKFLSNLGANIDKFCQF